jgi:hypothetical protein
MNYMNHMQLYKFVCKFLRCCMCEEKCCVLFVISCVGISYSYVNDLYVSCVGMSYSYVSDLYISCVGMSHSYVNDLYIH